MTPSWENLGRIDPKALWEARLQAHHAVQWAARAARANIMPMPGDTHSNFGWDRNQGALVSHELRGRSDTLRVGLVVGSMTLIVLRRASVIDQFVLDGKRHADAGMWLDGILAHSGLAPASGAALSYAIPVHPVGNSATYTSGPNRGEFAALANWFACADALLGDVQSQLPPGTASPVRCWPHHFDIATLWTLGAGDAQTAPSINIGLSPGDGNFAQPYFYVTPWPRPAPEKLPPLPAPGDWHSSADFVGAVLQGDALVALPDRMARTQQFLEAAVNVAQRLVAPP
ncbi:MAG TPA: hypothetical protein VG328_01270 [Stellaceae bacterium]|jgi:hypothetical protein|nr:hypothetical protein [Stellaceae bacterium]